MFALLRCLTRQTFNGCQTLKSLETQNFVQRFSSNSNDFFDDLSQLRKKDSKDFNKKFKYCFRESNEYNKFYENYFNDCNESNTKNGDNDNNSDKSNNNNQKFKSNSNTFTECKYHLLTLRLLEKVGYIGAAFAVGFSFESPLYKDFQQYKRTKQTKRCFDQLEVLPNDKRDRICGQCKHCKTFLSKLLAFASPLNPIKSNKYILDQNINEFVQNDGLNDRNTNSREDLTEHKCLDDLTKSLNNEIQVSLEEPTDQIDEICKQLQTASLDYVDRLNNMLGIALIEKDPKEAMKCWSNTTNNPKALFNMGVAFESGKHTTDGKVDLMRAYEHYALSASMGHKFAIYNLSLFYLYGKGDIQVDLRRAEALLERAAQLGVKPAKEFCDRLKLRKSEHLRQKTFMKTSSSAPNLTDFFGSCFESVNNEKSNKYQQNYSIATRVML